MIDCRLPLIAAFCSWSCTSGPPPAPAPPHLLTLITYNVQHGTDPGRQMDLIAAQRPRPAIVVLQEAHAHQESTYRVGLNVRYRVASFATRLFPHCREWNGTRCTEFGDEGVLILSMLPVLEWEGRVLPRADRFWPGRGAGRAKIRVTEQISVNVIGAHLPTDAAARRGAMDDLQAWAASATPPVFLGGDLNAVPGSPEIDALGSGYTDIWSTVQGPGGGVTFPSDGRRIDYWFVDRRTAVAPVTAATVADEAKVSDHLALVVTVDLKGDSIRR
jgi:endonuclease/exonuclease/phosphatase family metal-dependent hydrolase